MRIGGRQGISATAADIAGLNSSFLYVISDGHGHVKIGVTEDPKSRIAALRRESAASTLDFVYIGATSSDGFDIEQAARSRSPVTASTASGCPFLRRWPWLQSRGLRRSLAVRSCNSAPCRSPVLRGRLRRSPSGAY